MAELIFPERRDVGREMTARMQSTQAAEAESFARANHEKNARRARQEAQMADMSSALKEMRANSRKDARSQRVALWLAIVSTIVAVGTLAVVVADRLYSIADRTFILILAASVAVILITALVAYFSPQRSNRSD